VFLFCEKHNLWAVFPSTGMRKNWKTRIIIRQRF